MKLLLDSNISFRLAKYLEPYFSEIIHVDHCVLIAPATDLAIWEYAYQNNLIIVTKDDDYLDILNLKGFPPKIVLLKIGNQKNKYILQSLTDNINDIVDLFETDKYGVLEIFPAL